MQTPMMGSHLRVKIFEQHRRRLTSITAQGKRAEL